MSGPLKDVVFVRIIEDFIESLPISYPERQATEIEQVFICFTLYLVFGIVDCATYVARSAKCVNDLLFGDRTVMVWPEAFKLTAVLACVHSFDLVGVIEVDTVRF